MKSRLVSHPIVAHLALAAALTLGLMTTYNRWTPETWAVPVCPLEWDALFLEGHVKSYEEGAVWAFGSKIIPRLNAPYQANWNDFPNIDPLFYSAIGYLARLTGRGLALNLAFLLSVLLAGAGFYGATRLLGYKRLLSLPLAFAFASLPHFFDRNVAHAMILAAWWMIPLELALISKCLLASRLFTRRWLMGSFLAGVALGTTFPYIAYAGAQLAGFALLATLFRRQWDKARLFGAGLAGIAAGFVLIHSDSFLYWLSHGTSVCVAKIATDAKLFAAQLPGFLLPDRCRIGFVDAWTQKHFWNNGVAGPSDHNYLGLLAIAGLCALLFVTLRNLWARRLAPPTPFWQVLWFLLYSLAGGVNLLLATLGLTLFRETGRYGMVIAAIALLFLCRQLSRARLGKWSAPVALLLLGVAIFDQFPAPKTAESIAALRETRRADADFFQKLEAALPAGAMVFNMPVTPTPDFLLHYTDGRRDFEWMRAYVLTDKLRFSFGTNRGRGAEMWQLALAGRPEGLPSWHNASQNEREILRHDTKGVPPQILAERLSLYGFSAVLVDRLAYSKPDDLLASLRDAGLEPLDFGHPRFTAFRLPENPRRSTPPPYLTTGDGFAEQVRNPQNGIWQMEAPGGAGELKITHFLPEPMRMELEFHAAALEARHLVVEGLEEPLALDLPARQLVPVRAAILLKPGVNRLRLKSEPAAGAAPGNPIIAVFAPNFTPPVWDTPPPE
ncbi:MAG: hypothetical protein LBR12_01610 [Opitutaceae bacterium]|jgi:phosphoglycerol transferase|nr:hypothetical protein [Opitutaceae bacterium]